MLFFLLVSLLFVSKARAQEFTCEVTINTPKIQSADPRVFKNLQTAIQEFINTRRWTNKDYQPEERIDMNVVITLDKELGNNRYEAQLTVQVGRPVFNSGYNTVLMQHLDKDFVFQYGEYEVLDFTEGSYSSNITSTLAFYVYIALGMDADSFEELGGEVYLNKAQDILNAVPPGTKGWGAGDGNRSKYNLIGNLLNVRVQPLRRAYYNYHLLGLDRLTEEETMAEGISSIAAALDKINKVNNDFPASMIIQTFVSSKRDEILNVFEIADQRTRRKVYDIMIRLDGARAADYKPLLN